MANGDSSLLSEALRYAESGYAVFPCAPGKKEPITKNGHNDASTDELTIRAWWRRTPSANIGIAMRASGLVAVDPDTYKSDCGWDAFIADRTLPDTWQQATARGGRHYIFRAPDNASFPGKLARHVEIKWDGYIIAAPSIFEGKRYRCIADNPPADAPDWLMSAWGYGSSGGTVELDWERDEQTGLVVDGRENYLTALIFRFYQNNPDTTEGTLADRAWDEFNRTVDFTRPTKITYQHALKKACHILLKKPATRAYRQRLIEGIPPEDIEPELPAEEAAKLLSEHLQSFADELGWTVCPSEALSYDAKIMREWAMAEQSGDPPRLLVRGAAGSGKSRGVLSMVRVRNQMLRADMGDDYVPTSVWYVCPTIDLAEELAAAYGRGAVVIRGRTHGRNKGITTPCVRPDEVIEVTRAGITNVSETLCSKLVEAPSGRKVRVNCPARFTCEYYRQFERGADAEIYFMSQQMLTVTISQQLIRRAELLVIDESVLGTLTATPRGFDPQLLASDVIGKVIVDELRAGRDPRPAIRNAGHTSKSIRAHATALESDTPVLRPDMTLKQIRMALKKWQQPIVPRVLRKVADELPATREGLRCLRLGTASETLSDGARIKVERAYLQYRRHLLPLRKDLPVLVLDATGDADLLAAAIPGLKQVTIPAARNAFVRQTYGFTASMQRMNGEDPRARNELTSGLKEIAERHPSGLLVTYKDAEKDIALPDGWASEHFGNLRGIDRHKDRTAIVVVGRMQIAPQAAERLACALFYDDERPLLLTGAYEKRPVGFHMRDGSHIGVMTDRHVCPLVDKIRWQHSEAEIVQAVDRLRLVHRDTPADVWLFNEVPTITVDALRPYRRAMRKHGPAGAGAGPGARLLDAYYRLNGVLPIKHAWLAKRFPDLWRNENAVKMELRDVEKRGEGLAAILPRGVRPHEFRARGQKGRSSLVWAKAYADADALWNAEFGR